MCPMCATTAVVLAAGTGATGGLAGLLFSRRRPPTPAKPIPQAEEKHA